MYLDIPKWWSKITFLCQCNDLSFTNIATIDKCRANVAAKSKIPGLIGFKCYLILFMSFYNLVQIIYC